MAKTQRAKQRNNEITDEPTGERDEQLDKLRNSQTGNLGRQNQTDYNCDMHY